MRERPDAWTAEEDETVRALSPADAAQQTGRTLPPAEVVEKTGRALKAVYMRRIALVVAGRGAPS
jgi:hypothetical protein